MYQNIPVRIPEIPGKISLQKKNDTVYVRYVLRRTYDRERKMTLPEYKVIGVQIERMPSLMLPNENYEVYFDQEGKERAAEPQDDTGEEIQDDTKEREREQAYMDKRETYRAYKPFFTDLYYEIKAQSRKDQDGIVSPYLAESLNGVLGPLREMMQEEGYAGQLGEIRAGEGENGGMTYGELMVLMTKYKCALGQFRNERI